MGVPGPTRVNHSLFSLLNMAGHSFRRPLVGHTEPLAYRNDYTIEVWLAINDFQKGSHAFRMREHIIREDEGVTTQFRENS